MTYWLESDPSPRSLADWSDRPTLCWLTALVSCSIVSEQKSLNWTFYMLEILIVFLYLTKVVNFDRTNANGRDNSRFSEPAVSSFSSSHSLLPSWLPWFWSFTETFSNVLPTLCLLSTNCLCLAWVLFLYWRFLLSKQRNSPKLAHPTHGGNIGF